MSPHNLGLPTHHNRFPRVSGDEPLGGGRYQYSLKFSPRERG